MKRKLPHKSVLLFVMIMFLTAIPEISAYPVESVLNVNTTTSSSSLWSIFTLSNFSSNKVIIHGTTNYEHILGDCGYYIEPVAACEAPTDIVFSEITEDTVTVNWQPGGSEAMWAPAYGYTGWDPFNDDPISWTYVENPEVTFIDLEPNTDYDFYIYSSCGNDGMSEIIGPLPFTTLESVEECLWTVRVYSDYWGDEVQWALSSTSGVLLSSGVYGSSYDDEQSISAAGPLTFFISNSGPIGDNRPNYSVSNENGEILSGTLAAFSGSSLTFSDLNCEDVLTYDCEDLEANFGDACTDANGRGGIIDEDCNCFTPPSPCEDIIVMECGIEYNATLLPNSGFWTSYTDVIYEYYGSEQVWSFTAPIYGDYVFSTDEGVGDADFFLMDSCDPSGNNLIGGYWDNGDKTVTLTGGVTYYLIADLWNDESTTVTVKVTCPEVVLDGFVYEDGAWTPEHPSGISTNVDNIWVVNGSASGNDALSDTDANNVIIMSGANLDVKGVLNIYGDLVIDGDLIFLSGEDYDGQLGLIVGDIIGEATVHRYFKNRRSYRMVSSAVNAISTIHDSWQEGAISNEDNPVPGYGTHITGSTVDQQNGFDGTSTGTASMYTVDVEAQQFVAVANTDQTSLQIGEPYLLFVRGDRAIDLNNNDDASSTILRAKGNLHKGSQVQSFGDLSAGDFIMFGNPYQSAVDVNSVFASSNQVNVTSYYVYDSTIATYGAYVTVELPSGINTFNSEANQYLQPGQAAQVASVGGITEIHFEEAHKTPGNHTSTNAQGNTDRLTVQLFTTDNFNNGGPVHDSFGIVFAEDNNNDITRSDAVKPWNFYENLAIDHEGVFLSLEQRAMPVAEEVYQLHTSGYTQTNYTLNLMVNGLEDVSLYLEDRYTGTSTLLEDSSLAYSFAIDNNDPFSVATDRFSIRVGERSLGINNDQLFSGMSLFPNPLNDVVFYINAPRLDGKNVNVSISDVSGRQVYTSDLDCVSNKISVSLDTELASGVYLVTLKYAGEESTMRLIRE